MANVPTDPPVSRTIDYGALVKKLLGDEWHKHETVYQMGGGRKFESSDYGTQGIYGAAPTIVRSGTSTIASDWYIHLGTSANGDADDYRSKAITMVYAISTGTAVGTATATIGDFNFFTKSARFTAVQSNSMAILGGTRTNSCLQSEDFSTTWISTDTTVTANNTAAPDGTTTADLLTEGSAGTAQVIQTLSGLPANATFAVSMFVKAGNTPWVRFLVGQASDFFYQYFNLETGAIGSGGGAAGTAILGASRITAHANGWYRCVVVGSIGATTTVPLRTYSVSADGGFTRVNGATRYQWGAQFENSVASASNYIPTTTVPVTSTSGSLTYSISA